MGSVIESIFDTDGLLIAIFVPRNYVPEGIQFLTQSENPFQLGLMKRNANEPSVAHFHNPLTREIQGTQEFLLVRSGKMKVTLFGNKAEQLSELTLQTGDSILLASGGHKIHFMDGCEILEVKQGPYLHATDKTIIDSEII
jgi:hypothetical protein